MAVRFAAAVPRAPFEDPAAEALAEALLEVAGGTGWAVLLFGSRLVGTAPSPYSAYDLILVVDAYRPFYDRLRASGFHGRSAVLLSSLARVLAPNIVAFDPGLAGGEIAKVMILTRADFARALSPRARDHFLLGRLAQSVRVLRARDEAASSEIDARLARARAEVLRWAGPWLPGRFTAAELARRMLEVSYAGEVRPEAAGRVQAVFDAQEEFLVNAYSRVLEEAERAGVVRRIEGGGVESSVWSLGARPGALERLRWRLYFLRSKIRATSRWAKHVVTFHDWLSYIQRKVERRTGIKVEVTPMERRLPMILLWPKVFRVLRELRRAKQA